MKLRTSVDMSEYVTRPRSLGEQVSFSNMLYCQGVGQQVLVVRSDETALSAVQRFAYYMAEVGINLTQQGISVLAGRVEDSMMKVNCPSRAHVLRVPIACKASCHHA